MKKHLSDILEVVPCLYLNISGEVSVYHLWYENDSGDLLDGNLMQVYAQITRTPVAGVSLFIDITLFIDILDQHLSCPGNLRWFYVDEPLRNMKFSAW